jgi:putative GTP pyrophosphokinase
VTKTQIDRLGDRLKRAGVSDDDLRLLDAYRRSFAGAYEQVVSTITASLGLEVTGRPAKSTTSIAEKLRRESIRLTQMQDIAGCRVIVPDVVQQDSVLTEMRRVLPDCTVIDRRIRPSHGYRAVHVVVVFPARAIEIQLRTALQHAWAELSEKLADVADPAIKYGGGDESIQGTLLNGSAVVARVERLEARVAMMTNESTPMSPSDVRELESIRDEALTVLRNAVANLKPSVKR